MYMYICICICIYNICMHTYSLRVCARVPFVYTPSVNGYIKLTHSPIYGRQAGQPAPSHPRVVPRRRCFARPARIASAATDGRGPRTGAVGPLRYLHKSIYLSVSLSLYLSIYLSTYMFRSIASATTDGRSQHTGAVGPLRYLRRANCLSVCLSIYLSICLSIY